VNEDQKPETAGAAGTMTVRRYIYALMLGSWLSDCRRALWCRVPDWPSTIWLQKYYTYMRSVSHRQTPTSCRIYSNIYSHRWRVIFSFTCRAKIKTQFYLFRSCAATRKNIYLLQLPHPGNMNDKEFMPSGLV
jgi:hypothetical protein